MPHNFVSVLQRCNSVGSDFTDDANTEAGPRERLTPHDLIGQTNFDSDFAHFVLEQRTQWFGEFQCHVVGKPANIVMALDDRCCSIGTAAFDDVWIQSSLHEKLCVREAAGVLFENANEQLANCFALCFRLGDALQFFKEALTCVHMDEFDAHALAECLHHLFALATAHEAGINIDTRELRADCAVHDCCRNRRINATRQATDCPLVSDLCTNRCNLIFDNARHCPVLFASGDIHKETHEQILTT